MLKDWLQFFKMILLGFLKIVGRFFQSFLNWFLKLPKNERIFLGIILILGFFLVSHWRHYYITFEDRQKIMHKTSTDDFLLFIIFIALTMIPFLVKLLAAPGENLENKITLNTIKFSRIGGLTLITLYYILNMLFSERIDLSKEAVYSWQFYAFGLTMLPAWIYGLLGIKNYAQ